MSWRYYRRIRRISKRDGKGGKRKNMNDAFTEFIFKKKKKKEKKIDIPRNSLLDGIN